MQKFTLEKSRFFPYMAWTLIVGFSIFVGSLTLELREILQNLEQTTQITTSSLTPPQ